MKNGKSSYKIVTNTGEKKVNNICDNELCEILSSDESNEFIYEKNDDFIVVELISYICGNSKILSFYPCTNNNSEKNKYLYHFYKKKKVKLYLCLNTKNNEIYIYQVQRKYVENKKTDNPNYIINKTFLYSQKPNESSKNGDENKLKNTLQNSKEIKKENKVSSTNLEKKICITKLFDSVSCSYDISTIEYSKLENTDTQILDSLKSILEKKLKKNQSEIEHNIDSQKQQKKLIVDELDYKNDMIHKNSINTKSENKQDKNNINNKEIKLLYLNFHEPAHIFMNHFFRINQDNEENSVKEITGFLKDEKYEYIEKEHLKKSKRKKYSSIFGKIKNEILPCNKLENYQSDISICSTNLFFSDTEVITKESNKEVKEEDGKKEEDKYKKNKKKNNLIPLKRNNLKIKWLLLNLNLKKEEEALIQKYVMFKKTNLQKMAKELYDNDTWTYQSKNKSFRKKKKKNMSENNGSIKLSDKTQDQEKGNESTIIFDNSTQQDPNSITSDVSSKQMLEHKEDEISKTKYSSSNSNDSRIDIDNVCYIQNDHNNSDQVYILNNQTNVNEMESYEKKNKMQNIENNVVEIEKETNIKMSTKHQLEEYPNNFHDQSVCYSEINVLETNCFEKQTLKKRKIEKDQLYCDYNNNSCLNFEYLVKNGKNDLTISESTKYITYGECNDAQISNSGSNHSTDSSCDKKNNEFVEEIVTEKTKWNQFNNCEKQIMNGDVVDINLENRNETNEMEEDENYESSEYNEKEENKNGKCFFLDKKVNNVLDIIKIIYTNSAYVKYSENLKLYIGLYKNYTNIEKTKLEFLEIEKNIDIKILNWYINEKMIEKKNVWQLNNYKIDDCSLFRLNKFKYIDDSIIDFFNNYIYFYILNRNNIDGCKGENDKKNDIYIFNTFFYKKIELYDDISKAYLNTNRWIKKLNKKIYEYKYVFIPININNTHWSLVLIYFPFSDSNRDKNAEHPSNSINDDDKYKKGSNKDVIESVQENVKENVKENVSRNTSDDSDRNISIDTNSNSQCDKEEDVFHRYRSKSLDSYFLNEQKYCTHRYNKNNSMMKHPFKTIGKPYQDLTDLFEKGIEKNDEQSDKHKFGRKKTISGYLSDGNEHESSYISISDSSESRNNKKKNLSTDVIEQNSKKCKNENNIEEEKLVYMIYLDSLFPSTKGNAILEKLKKYIEHLFHRDYVKKEKRKKKKNNNNILSNSGENSDSSSDTYHSNTSGDESSEPKIYFKFVYPNIIPKQNNTYDCGIYIIYFILHLCLNVHLIETDLIKPFNKYIKNKYPDNKYNFNWPQQNATKNPYARIYSNNSSPWFDQKDICTKRKQMKKMLLYMKDVINWKSEKHIEILNLLFLMNHNDKYQRN
ncbi:sentrin-specific protease 2, putative [Plasmodium vinckei]|uniref:Sentrin-specific protease 2, putative n=1 Tax=Plasmodium vinckei TaxID=5860 RepID=A0A6V7TAB4_PLAVN|nr:sentrin-specific protease 2, putative [Plasmodium vinckei]